MTPSDWDSGFGRSVGVFLNGDGIRGRDNQGRRITDVNFLLYFNAHDDEVGFKVPSDEYAPAWDIIIDTAGGGADTEPVQAEAVLGVGAKSLVVLRAHSVPDTDPDHSVAASLAALSQTTTTETASLTAPATPAPSTRTLRAVPEAAPELKKHHSPETKAAPETKPAPAPKKPRKSRAHKNGGS